MTCACVARHIWSTTGQCILQASNDDGLCDACHLVWVLGGVCKAPLKVEPADLGSGAAHEPIRPIDDRRTAEVVQKEAEDLIG